MWLIICKKRLAMAAARETEPSGFHLETMIANDLHVWKDLHSGRGLHHWRLASQQEVDFVIEERGQIVPLEIKGSANVSSSDAKHLRKFCAAHRNSPRGVLLSADAEVRMLPERIVAAPWWAVV